MRVTDIINSEMEFEQSFKLISQIDKKILLADFDISEVVEMILATIYLPIENPHHQYHYLVQFAEWLVKTFGRILLCANESCYDKKLLTLLDFIEESSVDIEDLDNGAAFCVFLRKFKMLLISMGAVYSNQVFEHALLEEFYIMKPFDNFKYKYHYAELKNSKIFLHEELMQELYKPERINSWLMNGNNLDDYLM